MSAAVVGSLVSALLAAMLALVLYQIRRLGREVDHTGALAQDTRVEVSAARTEIAAIGRRLGRIERWQDTNGKFGG